MTTATGTDRSRTVMITEVAAAAIFQFVLSRVLARAVTAATTRETEQLDHSGAAL